MSKKTSTAVGKVRDQSARIRKGFDGITDTLQKYCIGQDDLIEGIILATIAQQHVVFIGPPGCNKSRLIDLYVALCGANERAKLERMAAEEGTNITEKSLTSASYTFCVTLDRFAQPDALIGPLDLAELKRNRWVRDFTDTLADCDFANLEELFSANGATLLSAVRVLNEREILNGGKRYKIRLLSAFASTNDEPLQHMSAFYDRFLFRFSVGYVPSSDKDLFMAMLNSNGADAGDLKALLSVRDVKLAHLLASRVNITKTIRGEIYDLRCKTLTAGVQVSDRRWHHAVNNVVRAAAWLRGSEYAEPNDLYCLRNVLWSRLDEQETIQELLSPYETMTAVQKESDLVAEADRIYAQATTRVTGEHPTSAAEMRLEASVELAEIAGKITAQAARERIQGMCKSLEKFDPGEGGDSNDVPF